MGRVGYVVRVKFSGCPAGIGAQWQSMTQILCNLTAHSQRYIYASKYRFHIFLFNTTESLGNIILRV